MSASLKAVAEGFTSRAQDKREPNRNSEKVQAKSQAELEAKHNIQKGRRRRKPSNARGQADTRKLNWAQSSTASPTLGSGEGH